jgi:membrane protein
MTFLLIFILCVIAALKITLQSMFAKHVACTNTDGILYNGFIFMAAFFMFLPSVRYRISWNTFLFGSFFGGLSVLFQMTYIQALSKGPVSLTVLINNFGMLIPVFVSALVFKEPFTGWRIAGTVLTGISFLFNVEMTGSGGIDKRWLVPVFATFTANGLLSVTQKVYTVVGVANEIGGFVCSAYFAATVLSGLIYLGLSISGQKKTFRIKPKIIASAALIGIILGLFQALNTYAAGVIDGTLLFPAYNGGVTLLLTIIGVLLFCERLDKRRWIGTGTGIIAIVLMSVPV